MGLGLGLGEPLYLIRALLTQTLVRVCSREWRGRVRERERERARSYPKSFCASSSAPAYAIVLCRGLGSCAWAKRVADEVGDGGFIYPSYSPKVSVFISTTRAFEELRKFSQISGLICTLFGESVSGRIASMFLFRYLFFFFFWHLLQLVKLWLWF